MITPVEQVLADKTINLNSPVPYYAQVKEALKACLNSGEFKPGDQLPGEADLCALFKVSRTVIRQALDELEYDGLILRRKGKGTFVAEPKIVESLAQKLTGFYQDMSAQGFPPVSRILKQAQAQANPKVAALLGLAPASLYAILEGQLGLVIARGHRYLEAVPASPYEANLLQVEAGSPLMLLDSVSYLENGTPLEYYHALHRGDRSRFEAELIRVREPHLQK